jgi:integrase
MLHDVARNGLKMTRKAQRSSFGMVRKLPSGRFQASYVAPNGQRRTAPGTFKSRSDADAYLAGIRVEMAKGSWRPSEVELMREGRGTKAITFGEYALKWMETRTDQKGKLLAPSTLSNYRAYLRRPLAELAERPLVAITAEDVRTWHAEMKATGKDAYTRKAYDFMKSVFKTAIEEDGLREASPCMVRGGGGKSKSADVVPPSLEQLIIIADSVQPRFRMMVLMSAWGALRWGEVTELRRKDLEIITRPDGRQHVQANITRGVTKVDGQFIVGDPKSEAGVRKVAFPAQLTDDILEHLEKNVDADEDALLFPRSDGLHHLSHSTFMKQYYTARKRADRADMNFHALRHFGGTLYAQAGATLKETQDRLGHSTTAAAMVYQHSTGRDDQLADRMFEVAMNAKK